MQKNFRCTDWLPGHTFKFRWIEKFTLIDSSRVIRARCIRIQSQLILPEFISFHTFSVIRQYQNYRKCTEKLSFSKNWSRTSLHSRFSVLFLWTRKLFFSKRTPQIYEFRKNYLALNSNTNLRISRHLALITHVWRNTNWKKLPVLFLLWLLYLIVDPQRLLEL